MKLRNERLSNNLSNAASAELLPSEIVQRVIELQRHCEEYVTEQPAELLADLYTRGLLKVGRGEGGQIVATFYELPLDVSKTDKDRDQVFRVGGLATAKTLESARVIVKMLEELREEVYRTGKKLVAKTENEVLGRYLAKMGCEELSFQEAKAKYPREMGLYVSNSIKDEDEYRGKKFYLVNLGAQATG